MLTSTEPRGMYCALMLATYLRDRKLSFIVFAPPRETICLVCHGAESPMGVRSKYLFTMARTDRNSVATILVHYCITSNGVGPILIMSHSPSWPLLFACLSKYSDWFIFVRHIQAGRKQSGGRYLYSLFVPLIHYLYHPVPPCTAPAV